MTTPSSPAEGQDHDGERTEGRWERAQVRLERAQDRVTDRFEAAVGHHRAWRWTRATYEKARDDRLTGLAAEVAFYALLGVVPFVLALAAALGWLEEIVGADVAAQAEQEILSFLRRALTSEGQGFIEAVERLFERPAPGALTFSAVALLVLASRAFMGLIRALDVIHGIAEHRSWLRQRLVALGLALGSALVVAVLLGALVLDPLLGGAQAVARSVGAGPAFAEVWRIARWPAVGLGAVAWIATVLHVAPGRLRSWRSALLGASVATALAALATVGLRAYVAVASQGANPIFGVLGGVLALVLWFWGLALAILVGAGVDAVRARRP